MCFNHKSILQRSHNGKSDMRRKLPIQYRGFSFLEVMAVIVIIGILAGAVGFKFKNYIDKAKVNRAKGDISTIQNAVEAFRSDKGRYPTNDEGLEVLSLTTKKDPWGRLYIYTCPGRENDFEIISYGRDGMEGGEGIDADINSWELGEVDSNEPATN